MLSQPHRLRRSADLRLVTRKGRRFATEHLVVYVMTRPEASSTPRAGFVVGKVVGNSVARHRVSRQLRHLTAPVLATCAPGTDIVIRALAGAHGADLAGECQRAWKRLGLHA